MKLRDKRRANNRFPHKSTTVSGVAGDGNGGLSVPNMPGYIYAMIDGRVQIVLCNSVSVNHGTKIQLSRDKTRTSLQHPKLKVISITESSTASTTSANPMNYSSIATALEYMASGGGVNWLRVQGMQIMPLRVGQYSGLTVEIQPGMVWNGLTNLWVTYQTKDLTAHLPSAAGKAALVLITVNTSGTIVATKGAEFTLASMTTPALLLANRPATPAATAKELCLVRMWTGQTTCTESRVNGDFYDLRFAEHIIMSDYALDVARGLIPGVSSVNKFGKAPSGVQTTASDIWSRCDSTPTQQIWLAPTAARIHAIVSSSASDDGSPVGVGARTLRIYGLKTWDLAETTEIVTLDGTTPVNTANSYVIIHRMKVETHGTTNINVGTITATAATDSTVTALILPGEGQTEMAIYGVPSIQSFYMTRFAGSIGKDVTAQSIQFTIRVNESPQLETTQYILKNDVNVITTGTSGAERHFFNPVKYAGPCIIKVQGVASTNDMDAKAAFDGYLVTN